MLNCKIISNFIFENCYCYCYINCISYKKAECSTNNKQQILKLKLSFSTENFKFLTLKFEYFRIFIENSSSQRYPYSKKKWPQPSFPL